MKFLFIAAVALFAVTAVYGQDASAVNAKYAEAAEALKAKNFTVAIPLLEQVIAEGAATEGAEGTAESAKKALPQAIYLNSGAAFQAGKLDEALAGFTKAAELAELYGNVGVLNNARTWIGNTVLKQGAEAFNAKDYATAAAIFAKGYAGNPNNTTLAMNLAMSYVGMGDYAKGNEVYRAIIALGGQDSRFAEAAAKAATQFSRDNVIRATGAAKAGDYAAAVAATDEVLAVVPTDALAALTRLQAYNGMKNWARIIETGDATIAAQTSDEMRSSAAYLVGAAYQNTQNFAKAVEYYGRVTAGANVADAKAQAAELRKAL